MKEEKTLVIAMPEGEYGADAVLAALGNSPSPFASHAILCGGLDISGNGDVLERANYSPSLSPDTTGVARMTAQLTFTTEWRASGVHGVPARIGTLLKGCSLSETIVPATAAAMIGNAQPGAINSSAGMAAIIAGMTKSVAPDQSFDTYRLTVVEGGAPGAAKFLLTGVGFPNIDNTVMHAPNHTVNKQSRQGVVTIGGTVEAPTFTFTGTWQMLDTVEIFVGGIRFHYQVAQGDTVAAIAAALSAKMAADARFVGTAAALGVITVALAGPAAAIASNAAAQSITLGNSGAEIELPVWAGNLNVGESFEVSLLQSGVHYDPVSEDQSSVSFWVFLDGALHRMSGARGTFSVSGQAAQYPTASWTFTGLYYDPVEYALPQGVVFEDSKPYKVELAELALYGLPANRARAQSFTFDIANEVTPNDNINAEEAFDEIEIVDRTPVAGCNPEAVKVGDFSPWARMRKEDTTRFHVAVGARGGRGNIIRIRADRANYTGAPYVTRQKKRAHDIGLRLARRTANGDDELKIIFE